MRTASDGSPKHVLESALEVLAGLDLSLHAIAPVITTAPVGPSERKFANSAAVVETFRPPEQMLRVLAATEQTFGRRGRGQRWGARVLDLDIVLWSGGNWQSDTLIIPHPEFRNRDFVLQPASTIAGKWRDPITNLSVAHIYARLTKPRPVPR